MSTLNSLAAQFGTLREEIQDIKAKVDVLSSRVDRQDGEIKDLKARSEQICTSVGDLSAKVDKLPTAGTMREIDNVSMRKSNVIIFNMTDNQSAEFENLKVLDKTSIDNLLSSLQLFNKINLQSFSRIGKAIPASTSHRPIKLRFGSPDQAQTFISTFWTFKKQSASPPELLSLAVSPDLSSTQLRMYRDCREVLFSKAADEQPNFKVVFNGFTPKLVKKKTKNNNKNSSDPPLLI